MIPSTEGLDIDEGDEENIYEVMKAHMRRKQEELDAKNAAVRQQARNATRPGPITPPTAAAAEVIAKTSDLAAVWAAARRWLTANARYLEGVLGHCCSLLSLNPQTGEATLRVPANQRGFTNEKARAKIEEALRAVTALPLKVVIEISEDGAPPPPTAHASSPGGGAAPAAQRVPPEIIEAVKQQPIIQQLMERLDATVVQVELLGAGEGD